MELTRKILIEKELIFGRYTHPSNVPNYVWEKTYIKLQKRKEQEDFFYKYIANEILSPMLRLNEWSTQNVQNVEQYIVFSRENQYNKDYISICFNRLLMKICLSTSPLTFKKLICSSWNLKRVTQFS
jgi:hypothetical protein